jgi:hypothetical protein
MNKMGRLLVTQMRFLRAALDITWSNHQRNTNVGKTKIKGFKYYSETEEYQSNWNEDKRNITDWGEETLDARSKNWETNSTEEGSGTSS